MPFVVRARDVPGPNAAYVGAATNDTDLPRTMSCGICGVKGYAAMIPRYCSLPLFGTQIPLGLCRHGVREVRTSGIAYDCATVADTPVLKNWLLCEAARFPPRLWTTHSPQYFGMAMPKSAATENGRIG